MKLLTLILLALAGGIHWLRCNPNRDASGRYRPNNVAERWGVYVVLAVVALLVLAGCAPKPQFGGDVTPSPTNQTDPPLNRAGASAESIDSLNKRAQPQSNDTGKAILEAQADEIIRLKDHLAKATESNALAAAGWVKREVEFRTALLTAQDQSKDWKGKHDRLASSWGYRFQVWVEWAWVIIKLYLAICAILFALRFVPGAVGAFAALAFSVLWIPGWANAFADNAFFRGWVPWTKTGDKK